ncbi:hypothetical protein AKUA2003_12740 [Apilactobacillus kunkeei]|nr:hypothetical protein AKUA1001_12770 [Apilactobacillus kunkeei]CAI2652298.1 hypothetical protein AKUA2003_12740 [Apilactobacillus kunkeei]CAI2803252.1 hypothetical protein AKUA2002_12760 [Apilactobacillus kunkeei]
MSTKSKLHDFYRNHAIVILIFIIMSVLSVAIMWHHQFITLGSDIHFHWERIWDLRESLVHKSPFPLVALNQYNQTGSAVMALYPQLGMLPIALLSLVIKSFIPLVYIVLMLRNFFALLVAYFASYSYNHNRKVSFIFASGYTLAATILFHAVISYDIGRSSSMIYLPLILFGFLNLLEKNDWIELSLGMSGVIMCHVVNTAISIFFLIIMALININKFFDKDKLIALAKAVGLTILLTALYWIPFMIIVGNNEIDFPPSYWTLSGTDTYTWYLAIIQNSVGPFFNVINALGLILGVVFFRRLGKYSKQLLFVGIGFVILCSNLFPWDAIAKTGINNSLQFSWRLNIIPQVIFCYLFAEIVVKLFKKESFNWTAIVIATLGIVFLQINAQHSVVNQTKNNIELTRPFVHDGKNYRLNNNKDFRHLIFTNAGIVDYYPSAAVKSLGDTNRHIARYNGNKKLKVKLLGNGKFSFNAPVKIKKMSLPFLHYHGISYEVRVDGKVVKTKASKRALITISNLSAGRHHVQIIVHRTKKELLSYLFEIAGIILMVFAITRKYIFKKNK